nr:hypothetical protein [Tanacetum cinerariifolium]
DVKLFTLVDLTDLDLLLKVTKDEGNDGVEIIMVNVIPPDHVDDVPVVELKQHDDVYVVPEHVLKDEDEDPKEEEFKEEEEPQEEEDDMEVDIEEDKNEPELTYPYEEVDPLNPPPPSSESEPEDVIEVENLIEYEDETVPASVHEVGTTAMEKLVEKLGSAKDKVECKKLKKELEEARQANARNDARGSGPVRGQDATPAVRECTFTRFMKCNPTAFHGIEGAIELRRWFEKTKSVFGISECAEGKKVKFAIITLQGPALTWWNAKVATMGLETVNQIPWTEMKQLMTAEFCLIEEIQRMKHALWNLKVKEYSIMAYTQRFNELALMCPRMVELERGKLNNQKQGNEQAMVTAPTDGKVSSGSLPLCERCFTYHVGPCMIKCHKCGKVGHKARYCKVKNVATGVNALPIPTCYDYGEQGHTRNRCPKKVKQEEFREVHGGAYAIKDAKPKGPNVVIDTFLLNNRYAFVLFDLGFDRSFMDTRFSSMLNIDLFKIRASYVVELVDGRDCTFDVIIGMDWLVKHDAIIICGEKVVRVPYGNKMLIVESDKGVSRLKVISCIKARKYVERGCHLFLAHMTEKKSKEKRLEDVPVIHDFPEVFPEEFPGLPSPRQVESRIDLVPRVAPVMRAPYRLAPSEMRELPKKYGSFRMCIDYHELNKLSVKNRYPLLRIDYLFEQLQDSVQFLGHVIDRSSVYVDPAKIEAIKNWAAPITPTEVRKFLGLVGYCQRFIEGFSLISKPLTKLTQKDKKYKWGKEEEEDF